LFDRQPKQRLSLLGLAGGERLAEPVGDGRESLRVEALRRVGELRGQRSLLVVKCVELLLKLGEPTLELAGFEVAALERLAVAVERTLGTPDLLGDRAL